MAKNTKTKNAAKLEGLEPRLLYSADIMSGALSASMDSGHDDQASEQELERVINSFNPIEAADDKEVQALSDGTLTQDVSREIVFVAANVHDVDTLLLDIESDASRNVEVVLLEASSSALTQISSVLAERTDLDAIHIFAHGEAGIIDFGTDQLDLDILVLNRETLSAWSDALSEHADMLIYGCDLAANDDGLALIEQLAFLTGADIAASDDLTGAASLGGDWHLEISTGAIEIDMIPGEVAQQMWQDTLATFTVTNLNSTGVGSLAWAIDQANLNADADVIEFAVAGTIQLTSGLTILHQTTIDGTSAPGYAGAPVVEINGVNAPGAIGFTFAFSSSGSALQGLAVNGFGGGLVNVHADQFNLADNYLGTNLAGDGLAAHGITPVYAVSVSDLADQATITNNVISGSTHGIWLLGADFATIQGNYIGTDSAGLNALANVNGINLADGSTDNLIGTDSDGNNDTAEANVISGNTDGIRASGFSSINNSVVGNYIGVNADYTDTLGNTDDGIDLGSGIRELTITGNTVSGNLSQGFSISNLNENVFIQGNFVGTDITGTQMWGNLDAGLIFTSANGAQVNVGGIGPGEGNIIAFNGTDATDPGVALAFSANNVSVRGNLIYSNAGLAIDIDRDLVDTNDPGDLDIGPNGRQNYPVILSATLDSQGQLSITGNTNDLAAGLFQLDVYASSTPGLTNNGEAQQYLFSRTISGNAFFSLVGDGTEVTPGHYISITATSAQGETSEFSEVFQVVSTNDEEVLVTSSNVTLQEGNTVYISNIRLNTTDTDNTPDQIVYTVTSAPQHGQLELRANPGVAITSFTQEDINNGSVGYAHDGSNNAVDAFDFIVNDIVGAGTAGTLNFNITLINDEQSLDVNTGVAVLEGGSSTITNNELSTSDVDNTTAELVYTVTTPPGNGQLELSSNPGVAITSFTQADIDNGLVEYIHDGSETTADNFAFSVDDGQGAVSTGTFNLTVTPVNDEQVLEISTSINVDEGTSLSIFNDTLFTSDVDNTPDQIVYTVTTLPTLGRLEHTSNLGVAITTFTQDDVNNGRVIYFHSTGMGASDSFGFSVDDGQGIASNGTFTININQNNDEQSLDVNTGQTVLEGGSVGITNSELSTSDTDNTTAELVYTVTTPPSNGQLELSSNPGVAINSFTQADIDAGLLVFIHDGSETMTDSFEFEVDDGQGTVSTGTFNLTVTPVNDEQSLDVNTGRFVPEGGNAAINFVNLATSDVDNSAAEIVYTVTVVPAHGQLQLTTDPGVAVTTFTQADINAGLLYFTHDGSETSSDSFQFTVDDGQGVVSTGTFNLTVTPVNDEESLDVNVGRLVSEGGSVAIGNTHLATSDTDNTTAELVYTVTTPPSNGQLELSSNPGVAITSFTQADIDAGLLVFVHDGSETTSDSFEFEVDDGQGTVSTGTFNLTVTPVNDEQSLDVNIGQTVLEGSSVGIGATELSTSDVDNTTSEIVYTVTTAPANGQLELTSNPGVAVTTFTQADIDAGLLVFVHDGSETTSDSFDFSVDDGQGVVSTGTFNLTVTPVNDEESLDVNVGRLVAEGGSIAIGNIHLATSDTDNTPTELVYTVTIAPANGQLELTTNPGVAITSFTQEDIDNGLLIYVHDGSETLQDIFHFDVDDGQGTVTSDTYDFIILQVNDEQSLDVNTGQTVLEGSSVSIGATELSTSDVDNTAAELVYTVTTPPGNGQLELSSNPGVAITSFTQADIDAGLLVFVHDGSETTADSFDFSVDDGQGTVSTGTFNIAVTPVNDEESLDVNTGQTVLEGGSVGISATELSTSDVDNTAAEIVYTVTVVPPAFGQLELTTDPGVAVSTFTQADIDAGLLIYVHNGSETSSDSFQFSVNDGQGLLTTSIFNITITSVNDEQSLDVNTGQTVLEGSSIGITNTELSTSDADNSTTEIVYTVTTAPANGQLELTSNPGVAVTSFTQADIDSGLVVFVHDGSETTSDSFEFEVDDGQGAVSTGTFNLTVTPVNDEQSLDINGALNVAEGSQVTITNSVLSTSDVDNTASELVYTLVTTPSFGQLEYNTNPGVLITSFTQADIDAGIVVYVHDGSETSSDSIDFMVDDGQGVSSSGNFAFLVTPVNDEQSLDVNTGQTVTEGASIGIGAMELATSDVDNTALELVYTVTTPPTSGQLELTSNSGVAITSFTQADVDAGLLVFVHDGSETTADSFDFSVDDGQGTVTTGTFNIAVTPVNDEQSLDINTGQTVLEGGSVGISATELSTSDIDNTAAELVYAVTTPPGNGQLELSSNPGVAITSFTQADIDTGLLVFVHDGSETIADSFDFSVDDGQGIVSTGTFNISVTPTNDDQSLDINTGQTVLEGGSVSITNSELATSDVDNAAIDLVYTITSPPANGQLELTTNPGIAIVEFTQADIDNGLVIFVHDGSETTTDSFDFSVDDREGSVSSATFSITVTPVNDEESIDINTGQTVNEGDTVGITNLELLTSDADTPPDQIVYTIAAGPLNGHLELTSNPGVVIGTFTQADIDSNLLVYVHDGSNTTNGSFAFSVDDGAGTNSSGTFTITVLPANDEQTLDVNTGQTVLEGGSVGITNSELSTSDVDNTTAELVYTVTTSPSNGQLELSSNPGVAVTSFTQADIDAGLLVFVHDGSETTADSFDFSVDDGQGAVSTGTFNLNVTPVNDEQSLDLSGPLTVAEGSQTVITNSVLATSDSDNLASELVYTITTSPSYGQLEYSTNSGVLITSFTQADIDAGIVVYVHSGGEIGDDTFDFIVDDGQGISTSGNFNFLVTQVNDEQSLDTNTGQTVTEGGSIGIGATELSTSDPDSTALELVYTVTTPPTSGQLELATNPGVAITSFTQEDIDNGLLVFVHDGSETAADSFEFSVDDGKGVPSSGTFNLTITPTNDEQILNVSTGQTVNEGGSVSITNAELGTSDPDNANNEIVYIVTTTPTNGQLELTTNPGVAVTSFTQAEIDNGLLVFVHDGSESTADNFSFEVDDGQGTVSTGTFNIVVTPVNDEQLLNVNTGQTVMEGGSVGIGAAQLATSDVDNSSSQIVYTVTAAPTNGQLELTTNPSVAVTTFTQADIDAGLLIFVHDGSETESDIFQFSVDDGQGFRTTSLFNINVTPVNDEQTLNINAGQSVTEGGSVGITNTELNTTDIDNTAAELIYTMTNPPTGGQLELTSNPGVAVISFTQADIDNGLIVFVHDGSENTSDSFDFSVDDGTGAISTGTFNLAVTPVNDEQSLDTNNGQTVVEGNSVTISTLELSTSDADNSATEIVYTVTSAPINGQLELTSNPGIEITSFTQADIDNGVLVFVHNGNENTTDSFDFSVDDGEGIVTFGAFNISVTPFNDEQSLDVNTGQTVNEGSSVVITDSNLSTIDIDNTPNEIVYTITTPPSNGQLELASNPGVAINSFTQADIDSALLVFVHNGTETTTDSFNFSVDDGQGAISSGNFILTVVPTNDEQIVDVNTGQTVFEGGTIGISSTELATSDVDNPSTDITYTVTSLPNFGQLELTTNPGVSIDSFTQADIDAGLLVFVHDGSETSSDRFGFAVTDGLGVVSEGNFELTVTPINDAPVNLGTVPDSINGNSDTTLPVDLSTLRLADADSDVLTLIIQSTNGGLLSAITSAEVDISGNDSTSLQLSGSADALGEYLSDSAAISYNQPEQGTIGENADSLTLNVDDNDGSVVSLGLISVDLSNNNEELGLSAPDLLVLNNQISLDLQNQGIVVSYDEFGSNDVTITLSVDQGTLLVVSDESSVGITGNGTTSVELQGNVETINNVLSGANNSQIQYLMGNQLIAAQNIVNLDISVEDSFTNSTGSDQQVAAAVPILINKDGQFITPGNLTPTVNSLDNISQTDSTSGTDTDPLAPQSSGAADSGLLADDTTSAIDPDELSNILSNQNQILLDNIEEPERFNEYSEPLPIIIDDAVAQSIRTNDVSSTTVGEPIAQVGLIRELLLQGIGSTVPTTINVVNEIVNEGYSNRNFVDALDDVREDLDDALNEEMRRDESIESVVVGASAVFTVGIIGWLTQAGSFFAGMLSSVPLWRNLDPFAIIAKREEDEERKPTKVDNTLERLFKRRKG